MSEGTLPSSWFAPAKLSSSRRDCSAQIFRHHASQLLSKWREKAHDDPRGWFRWYPVTTSAAASGRTFGTILVLLLAAPAFGQALPPNKDRPVIPTVERFLLHAGSLRAARRPSRRSALARLMDLRSSSCGSARLDRLNPSWPTGSRTGDCADEVILSRKGTKSRTRVAGLRSSGTKATSGGPCSRAPRRAGKEAGSRSAS